MLRRPKAVAGPLDKHIVRAQPRDPNAPRLTDEFGRLVELTLNRAAQLWGEAERLERELEVEGAATPEQVRRALNRAERNASDAHLLYLSAKLEFERHEVESAAYLAPFREHAAQELQTEKDGGKRSKAITDADVSARMASLYPDAVADQARGKAEAEATVKQLSRLADLWKQRAYSLSGMISPRS